MEDAGAAELTTSPPVVYICSLAPMEESAALSVYVTESIVGSFNNGFVGEFNL